MFYVLFIVVFFFFSSRRRHTRCYRDWSSDVCSSDLARRRYEEAEQMQAARLARTTADIATAEERRRYARNDLERFQALFAAELISRRTLEEAQELAGVREKELTAARAELRTVSAGDLSSTGDLAGFRKEMAVAQKEAEESRGR